MTGAAGRQGAMNLSEWAMLLGLSVLWGGSFFFNEIALAEIPVMTLVLCRVALAALALLAICRLAGLKAPREPRILAAFLLMGALNNAIPFSLIVCGQTSIASGLASILNAMTPIFTILVAHFALADAPLSPSRLSGAALGLIGVAVLIGGDALFPLGTSISGQLACLAAALAYACATVYGRRFQAWKVPPLTIAAGQTTAASLILTPIALMADRPWSLPPPGLSSLAAVLAVALLSTALAYVLFFRMLATAGPVNLALVTFLIPVTAVLLGAAFLGEVLEAQHLLGMVLIGAGLAAIDGRAIRAARAALCSAWRRGAGSRR